MRPLGVGSGAAAAPAPPLSHEVLSRALPGFALLPKGLFDGPLPKAMLDSYSDQAQWKQDVANGSLTGFVRAWSRTYQRGLALIYLTAIRMPDPSTVALFTSSIEALAVEPTVRDDVRRHAYRGGDGVPDRPSRADRHGDGILDRLHQGEHRLLPLRRRPAADR